MSVRCPYCGREYDVTLFEFDSSVICICGKRVTMKHEEIMDKAILAQSDEDRKVSEIKKMADQIAFLIVASDYPFIDIEIEKQKLKNMISELFPDKVYLYDLIYESRFRRLTDQFRN